MNDPVYLDISNEDVEKGDPRIFSCKLGRFWLFPLCNNSQAVADFCIDVGEIELGKVADFFVVVGEPEFDKAPKTRKYHLIIKDRNCPYSAFQASKGYLHSNQILFSDLQW